jgi:hypothetical protein
MVMMAAVSAGVAVEIGSADLPREDEVGLNGACL